MFLDKASNYADHVVMVEPKFIINTSEFNKTRELLSKFKINSIYDFGEKGFKGVLIETVCIAFQTNCKQNSKHKVHIEHKTKNISLDAFQNTLTSSEYPYWILYRNNFFDEVASTLQFGTFKVFRDRQITNKDLHEEQYENDIRVLKSRNITDDGKIINIEGYDSYINRDDLSKKSVYQFFNNQNVYLVPNMTYKPRMIQNPINVTVNGSLAILVPLFQKPSEKQIKYFSSDEFREFYQIARNYQTRSLNIDETSVYFFGLKEEDNSE